MAALATGVPALASQLWYTPARALSLFDTHALTLTRSLAVCEQVGSQVASRGKKQAGSVYWNSTAAGSKCRRDWLVHQSLLRKTYILYVMFVYKQVLYNWL